MWLGQKASSVLFQTGCGPLHEVAYAANERKVAPDCGRFRAY
jgi:hypothetical protein